MNDVDDIREKLMGIGTITQVHIRTHVTNVAAVACILLSIHLEIATFIGMES